MGFINQLITGGGAHIVICMYIYIYSWIYLSIVSGIYNI